ncbi:MAG: gluconokinase [Pyrinomonadaceae bacterium]
MKSPLFLALDIGTSSVRSALYDREANVLPHTMVKNERQLTTTQDGGYEIDAEEAFLHAVSAIDTIQESSANHAERILYAATSSFWHSILGIDKNGDPTTKVFAWGETRPAKYTEKLRADLDEDKIHNRTGCRFHSSYWTAKLLWLRNEYPQEFERTDRWISFSDYLSLKIHRMSDPGEVRIPVTGVSMASGTGIFDIRNCVWDAELLAYLGISENNLPKIVPNDNQTFFLNDQFGDRWSFLKETKWFSAIGDGAGNNIGANCVSEERAALMIGTSGAMRVAFEGEVPENIPEGLWCYRIDRKRIIIGGALSDGGGLYGWLKKNFRLKKDDDKTEAKIEARKPDQHGITFLPFLAGERSTGYHDFAEGAILGLRHAHDKIDIVQAALESVAYRFAEIYDQLLKVSEIKEIIASGGALRESPVWTQIICDVLAQNMDLPDTREASSRGVVLLASEMTGEIEDISRVSRAEGAKFTFDPERHAVYREGRRRHRKFYNLLIGESGRDDGF